MTPIALAGPAVEPVPLDDMKRYLRLDGGDEDELVAALIVAGRITVERRTRLCLIEQSWRLRLRAWPADGAVRLPLAPVIAVDAVRLVGPAGATGTLPATAYRLDRDEDPARLLVDPGGPEAALSARPAVEIDLTCGFGATAAAVPEPLLLAIRRMAAHWFEHRGDGVGAPGPAVPADAAALLAPFVRPRLA